MKDLSEERPLPQGMTYAVYQAAWAERIEQPLTGLDKKQRRHLYYARYNKARSEQVHQAYAVSDKLRAAIEKIEAPQHWMILTEDWCADSAYILPVLVEAAQGNALIDVRILLRDDHLDVMDQYLTGAARSIPKLVVFSEEGHELFRWGPRPEEARRLREQLMAEGLSGGDVSRKLMAWYDEGGWRQADDELTMLLEAVHRVA